MKQRLYRLLATPLALLFINALALTLTAPALAQDNWDFDDWEVDDFSDDDWDFDDFSEDDWDFDDFSDDDWGTGDDGWGDSQTGSTAAPTGPKRVTGLIVPTDDLPAAIADQITAILQQQLADLGVDQVVGNDSLREEFEIMGSELAMECAFDPICIGRNGRRLGYDHVVVGRVNRTQDGLWGTTIDLFETAGSSILAYRYFETAARVDEVEAAMPAQLRHLYGIREERRTGGVGRVGPSPVQRGMAWTTAGLAVGSLATGIVFGLKARSGEDDLRKCTLIDTWNNDVVCDMTQREARPLLDDAKHNALLSNIFLGSGAFLGAISVVLFTVTPGGDIDEEAAQAPGYRFQITPTASRDGLGLNGAWSF